MKFLLYTNNINDYFEKLNKIGFISKSSTNCYEFEILKKFGQGKIERYTFKNGMDMSLAKMKLNTELNYNFEVKDKFFEVLYIKSGYVVTCDKNMGEYKINAGECIVTLKDEFMGWVRHPKGIEIEYLSINIEEKYIDFINEDDNRLKKKFKDYKNKNKNKGVTFKNIDLGIGILLEQIWQCNFENFIKRMYFQSKAGEIFCEIIAEELTKDSIKECPINLSRDDIDRLYYAKKIVTDRMTNPPSLKELSKEICLNTYKLKVGFKALFYNTVYGYLKEIRMEKARNLLKNTNLRINDIALQVGYSNSSNFSLVFKKKYNVSPKDYRKL